MLRCAAELSPHRGLLLGFFLSASLPVGQVTRVQFFLALLTGGNGPLQLPRRNLPWYLRLVPLLGLGRD